ncbi:hypothetical protein PIB30_085647, partial [Stylosanthes scabra]|nr:hypothetical protein [Stylosanthes scabra]
MFSSVLLNNKLSPLSPPVTASYLSGRGVEEAVGGDSLDHIKEFGDLPRHWKVEKECWWC